MPFGVWDYASFAVAAGIRAGDWRLSPGLAEIFRAAQYCVIPVCLGLVVSGLWVAFKRPRTWILAGSLAYLLAAALYYALLVRDPWSGERATPGIY